MLNTVLRPSAAAKHANILGALSLLKSPVSTPAIEEGFENTRADPRWEVLLMLIQITVYS